MNTSNYHLLSRKKLREVSRHYTEIETIGRRKEVGLFRAFLIIL